jgi:hypothetical protein
MAKPDPKDVLPCPGCKTEVLWLAGPYGVSWLVNAEPVIESFRPPYAGEMKYVHGEHEPHWCWKPEL